LAGNIKQVVERIRNKIPFNKGISRMPVNSLPGFLGDMQNFEYSDGTVKNRMGSRVINFMSDNLWYHIETFQICGVNVTLGLNYKRELWAWLPQWPETDFRVCNSSPFRTYRHTSSETGISQYTRHFSFTQGNKFWMKEDAQTVIMFSDYGEIFRIMKNGFFRITADDYYADQADLIESIREDFNATTGRIYLDIKDSTNKVFDTLPYAVDDVKKNGHRIQGDVRFAWVNELGVVSELSEPMYFDKYRHSMFSLVSLLNFNQDKKTVNATKIIKPNAVIEDRQIGISGKWNGSAALEFTVSGDAWTPTNPYSTHESDVGEVYGVVMIVMQGEYWDNTTSTNTVITPGIYMCMADKATGDHRNFYKSEHIGNFAKLQMLTVRDTALGGIFQIDERNISSFPRVYAVDSTDPEYSMFKDALYVLITQDGSKINDITVSGSYGNSRWVKFKNDPKWIETYKQHASFYSLVIDGTDNFIRIEGIVAVVTNLRLTFDDNAGNPNYEKSTWHNDLICAMQAPFRSDLVTGYIRKPFDCWELDGEKNLQPVDVDINGQTVLVNSGDSDVILSGSELEINKIMLNNQRFAVWNDNHIVAVSQRCFVDGGEIVYEGLAETIDSSYNFNQGNGDLKIGAFPVCAMDYTGIRKIPYPLPLVARAIRSPKDIAVSGDTVYVVEGSKVWFGSVNDMLLRDSVNSQASIYMIAEFDAGIVASTNKGLFYVARNDIKSIFGGESILPRFIAVCSGGVIAVEGRDIYIIYKHITDSGAWYPSAIKINPTASEINLEGELKTVSIGKYIYLADDWNVWIYNIDEKMWCGKFNYGSRIHRLFVFNGKLAVSFDSGIDRKLAFDRPHPEQGN